MKLKDYRIVVSENANTNELRSAAFLRDNIKLVCGKTLDVVMDTEKPAEREIVVGMTNREELDGISLERTRGAMWEYVMRNVGTRFYLTGLGEKADRPEKYNAHAIHEDGSIGTVMAAYRFVEDILGYDFINSAYESFPENEELEIPENYEFDFTRNKLRAQEPANIEGAAMFSLNCSEDINWNTQSMIFRTRTGKIVVMDGGQWNESDRFMRTLKKVAGCEKPHVSAWIFSHMHPDHWGVYDRLCRDEEFRSQIIVDNFYCNLITKEYYTELSCEKWEYFAEIRQRFLDSESTVGAKVHTVNKGDVIKVDEIEIEVLHVPEMRFAREMDINDSSVVYKLIYDGKQSIMLLGDAEYVCDMDLVNNMADKLKSDVVQVGHHGCGNVSGKCYELIGADSYIWPIGERFWYSDNGTELNTHNTGVIRTRDFMMQLRPKKENVYLNIDDILSFPLPMPIY